MVGRNLLRRLVMSALVVVLCTLSAFAANQVDTIDVAAVIQPDGSMDITQTWTGTFDSGTENYIPMNLQSAMELTDFTVTSQGKTFETVDSWDVDWSFGEKAYRCGINKSGGVFELCYGISEYGSQSYTLSYSIANVFMGYSDYDAINFRFVNDKMNTTPTAVTVEISLADGTPLTDEIADIWGFGYEGEVAFSNGNVVAVTQEDITARNHVTVMLALEKGVIIPGRSTDHSFDTMKSEAFRGSDYEDSSSFQLRDLLIGFLVIIQSFGVVFVMIGIAVVKAVTRMRHKRELKHFAKDCPYFREIPNGGDLNMSYTMGRMFGLCEEGAILSTRMLRLIDQGCLAPTTEEKVRFFGLTKEMVSLRLNGYDPSRIDTEDAQLYDILEKAAGDDGILQSEELEVFLKKKDRMLRNYIDMCRSRGKVSLMNRETMKGGYNKGLLKRLTPAGQAELAELMGFKQYLEDFTLIAERGVKELPIWKELLTYAMLFGIADKVAKQLEHLYPDLAPEVACYRYQMNTAHAYHCCLYANMRRAEQRRAQKSSRRSGGGGRSSSGGGGGSSGGGSGGGSR